MAGLTLQELENHLASAVENEVSFWALTDILYKIAKDYNPLAFVGSKIVSAGQVVVADIELVKHSHTKYLPAARDYRNYMKRVQKEGIEDYANDPEFKSLRGRLGAASKGLYAFQRETFLALVSLILGNAAKAILNDAAGKSLWLKFQRAEQRWLTNSRHKSTA